MWGGRVERGGGDRVEWGEKGVSGDEHDVIFHSGPV